MSFFTSLSGLRNAETDLRVIAHNIANAETVGFKKSSAQFADLVSAGIGSDPKKTPGIGATLAGITQNFGLGQLEQTGRSLDLAISGDGFFTLVEPISGSRSFTRNGSFQLGPSGDVRDMYGSRLQAFPVDASGTATSTVPADLLVAPVNAAGGQLASVSINERGVVTASYSDGTAEPVGQVALATFAAPSGLRAIGQSQWQPSGESGAPTYGAAGNGGYGDLLSGVLERSNVDLAEEMVALLNAQRNFQANARAIDTATQITQTVLNLRS